MNDALQASDLMSQLHRTVALGFVACVLFVGCSEKAPPPVTPETSAPMAESQPDAANVTRSKLNAHGVPTQYAAEFDAEKLVKITEERTSGSGATLDGEYTFQGARLLRYRGAKVQQEGQLDLQFDLQGVLQSGRGPDVTDEDIATIRDRAQLLRSHALAQRAARGHSDGH
jgi:hypothetical protein